MTTGLYTRQIGMKDVQKSCATHRHASIAAHTVALSTSITEFPFRKVGPIRSITFGHSAKSATKIGMEADRFNTAKVNSQDRMREN